MATTPVKHERSTVRYANATTSTITAGTLVEIATGYVGVALADIAASTSGELAFGCDVTATKATCPAISNGAAIKILSGTVYDSANTSATTMVNARAHEAAVSTASTIVIGIW